MDKLKAIDIAQIKSNLTGERWYAIQLDKDLWTVCDEQSAAIYIAKPHHITYPENPSHNRQSGVGKRHIGKAHAKHR